MKRFFGILLLCAVLVTAVCPIATVAFAEANDVELSLELNEDGEDVVADVFLTKNDGVIDLYLRVEYDPEALELVGRTFQKALAGLRPMDNFSAYEENGYEPPYRVEYLGEDRKNLTDTGLLFSLRFKVKEGAKNGNHTVKLVVRQVGYLAGDSSVDPIYNAKYGDHVVWTIDGSSMLTGGVTVAEKLVVLKGGEVDSIRTVESEEAREGMSELMIGLIVGGVMILVGALVVAYIVYRRKNAGKNAQ